TSRDREGLTALPCALRSLKKMIHRTTLLIPTAAAIMVIAAGCMDTDPFGLSSKRIAGKYQLEQFESGNYYLLKDGHKSLGGGFIDGTVLAIGWDTDIIAAKRYANFRGDPHGWMIIDLRSDSMTGPLTDEDFKTSYPSLT